MTFDPQKLSVTIVPPVTETRPIARRKYTLTHSDITGELFLTVSMHFDIAAINPVMRDEVIAEWKRDNQNRYILAGNVHVDGSDMTQATSMARFNIFQKEMDTTLKGTIYGDKNVFTEHPYLLNAPIYIQFDSVYPAYNRILYFGTPGQYLSEINLM